MGDSALPYVMPRIRDEGLEIRKYVNLLKALHARRQRSSLCEHLPLDVTIDMTTSCQLHCPHCAVGNGTIRRPVSVMKRDLFERILGDLGDTTFIAWYFSTGEPLLNKNVGEFLATTKKQEIFSVISTNLSFPLSDDRIDQLLQSGLGMLSVSLDGATAETYRRYRVGGDFELVVDNLRRFIDRKRQLGLSAPLIEWRFLRFGHNEHEEELARTLAREWGVDLLEFHPGSAPSQRSAGSITTASRPMSGEAVEGPALDAGIAAVEAPMARALAMKPMQFCAAPAKAHGGTCDWLYYSTMIYPNGSVGPCCVSNDLVNDFSALAPGVSFTSAWNDSKFRHARRQFVDGTPSGTVCDRCPLPAAQTYQFTQKIRAILRIAPPWVLKILTEAPDQYLLPVDAQTMPHEIGLLLSPSSELRGEIEKPFPHIADAIESTFPQDDFSKKLSARLRPAGEEGPRRWTLRNFFQKVCTSWG